ncbi:MAG: small-conductance mechanosensitive channel [Gammaproteobacteria bacterium]|jgi:small-conductance mechanosensitive channel
MEFLTQIQNILIDSFNELLQTVSSYLPNLVSALALFVFGLFLAWLVKWIIIRLSAGMDRMVHVVGFTSIPVLRNWPIGVILGWLVFWLLNLFFVTAAVESMGFPGLANWLGKLINNLPLYFIAIMIVFVGLWIGNLANNKIQASVDSTGRRQAEVLGRALRMFIISIAVISALSQIGLDVSIFEKILVILLISILAAIALAFGLGAGPALSNVISGRYVKKTYQLGQRIMINGIEGEILEMLATGVVLDTNSGRTFIPAKIFTENTSVLLDNDGGQSD